MARGGNRRFKEYLTHYEVHTLPYDKKLKTKAAQYYRILVIIFLFSSLKRPMDV